MGRGNKILHATHAMHGVACPLPALRDRTLGSRSLSDHCLDGSALPLTMHSDNL